MDVILWNSGAYFHGYAPIYRSLGAYKIANSVRSRGYHVQTIDFINHLTADQLYSVTKKFLTGKTICLGISTTFLCQLKHIWPDGRNSFLPYHVYQTMHRLKKERPFLKIVLGGYRSEKIPTDKIIDSQITGYGEDIFPELIDFFRTGKNEPIYKISHITNDDSRKSYVSARNPNYDIKNDTHRFHDNDCIMPGESLPLEISRGCIFTCKFCNHLLLGRRKDEYLRDIEYVKEEIRYNYDKWQTKNYFITCDTFNDNQDKMQAWHKSITELDFKINFACYLRADLLERFQDTAYMLKESGLLAAFHGMETLHEFAAKSIGKAWNGNKARTFIPKLYHDIWNKEVYQHLNFIVGLPNETKESIVSTANWFIDQDLYSILFDVLGINKTWKTGSSEFSRNYEKYGYNFKSNSNDEWYTSYWSKTEAETWMNNILQPYILPYKGWFASFQIIGIKTLGYDDDLFDKKTQTIDKWPHLINDVNLRSSKWISNYYSKLMSL